MVAAYREEQGYAHETDPIGPAPERGSPEQRASWHAAYTTLRMPEENRAIVAVSDGELWARRQAYTWETAWAPPFVAKELRAAHLAEDAYRADAVRAWYRADAATDHAERIQAQREAEECSVLAQEVGSHREALTEVAEARRRWHATTELSRQQALAADAELRRRYPDMELPPLHPTEEAAQPEPDAQPSLHEPDPGQADIDPETAMNQQVITMDVQAALTAARKAEKILTDRERRADHGADRADDDLMRRREAEAAEEALAQRSAVRQDPAPSRHTTSLERQELELEAGH
jgi:hypothetical protein